MLEPEKAGLLLDQIQELKHQFGQANRLVRALS